VFVERKRRRLTVAGLLPVLVVTMFLIVAKLAAWQRADVIQSLDRQVTHGSTREAVDAVRSLAMIPRPPLALLVKAAESPNLKVAREAQRALSEYLRFCQRQVKLERNTKSVARQLGVLAEALAVERPMFSVTEYHWLERTTRKVLRLANQIPTNSAPLVAARCDEVLTAVAAVTPAVKTPSLIASAAPVPNDSAATVDLAQDERLAALATRSWSNAPRIVVVADTQGGAFPITFETTGSSGSIPGPGITKAVDQYPVGPSYSGWRAQWTHPILRTLPSGPTHDVQEAAVDVESASNEPGTLEGDAPNLTEARERRFEGIDSRRLFARWLTADGSEGHVLEQELMERGFGRLSPSLVRQLLSEQSADRLRLLDDVLTDPSIDARPWLLLLADDEDSDVRLVAVTIMATSRDPELIEKAWQVSIHDHDPRIAGLAERLRERRGGVRRR
jgi:hypothetical protein